MKSTIRKGTTGAILAILLMGSYGLPTAYSNLTAKVTICHRGHTIQVAQELLPSYLALGDTEGACQVTECQNR